MADVHQFPDMERMEEEASDWIARLHADRVSDEDLARFAAWRAAHPLHARTYDGMSAAWRAFSAAGPLVRAVSFGESMNEATKPVKPRRRWVIASAAAAAVVLVAVALYLLRTLPQTAFETGIGEQASVSLPDGSMVELNSNSRVRVDYSDHARVIRLQRGEAFFDVAHDPSRPFWVYGGRSWVRAVGTAFSVYLRPEEDVRVTVAEGTVQLGGPTGASVTTTVDSTQPPKVPASVLSAGQQADMKGDTASIRSLPPAEINRSLAWRNGKLSFVRQPLGEVIEEMSRYTTVDITVRDDKLRQLPVGGTFQANAQGAETLVSMLRDGFGLHIRREAGHVYIEDAAADSSE